MPLNKHESSIRVYVRIRPPDPPPPPPEAISLILNTQTNQENDTPREQHTLAVKPGGADRTFCFHRVFDIHSTQQEIYNLAAKDIVKSVLSGFNGAVIAYGQTGSGKTHTIVGSHQKEASDPTAAVGIIPRAVNSIFAHIVEAKEDIEFQLKASIFEIYMERIRDLIDPNRINLKVRESKTRGVYIEDLTECYVTTPDELFELLRRGQLNRSTSATLMNEESSRSHLIFCITVQQKNTAEMTIRTGKLFMVDLAGSEKVSRSGAEGVILDEARKINKSLASLGNVINALTTSKGNSASLHVPYRDSKLTRVLEDAIGGNAKTCLICTVSCLAQNEAETLSTLRFGQRAKLIRNLAMINEQLSQEVLEKLLKKAENQNIALNGYIKILINLLRDHQIQIPVFQATPDPILENSMTNSNDFVNSISKTDTATSSASRPTPSTTISFVPRSSDAASLSPPQSVNSPSKTELPTPPKRGEEEESFQSAHEQLKSQEERQNAKLQKLKVKLKEEKKRNKALRILCNHVATSPIRENLSKADAAFREASEICAHIGEVEGRSNNELKNVPTEREPPKTELSVHKYLKTARANLRQLLVQCNALQKESETLTETYPSSQILMNDLPTPTTDDTVSSLLSKRIVKALKGGGRTKLL